MLLNVNKVTKYVKDKKLLDNVSFKLYKNEKLGVIGDNGAGKSTLLKIIMSHISFDDGYVKKYGRIGYLPQDFSIDEEKTVEEFLKDYEMDGELMAILKSLKLKDKYSQKIITLSGGEKTRLYFAGIILSKPKILILDEPTNHMDYEGINWLEKYVSKFEGGIIVVSHDRYFLDKTVSKILELDDGKTKEYSGNYSFYKEAKDKEFERAVMEYERYKKERKKLEEAARKHMERANRYNNMSQADFYRGKAAKIAKKAKSIKSRVDHMQERNKPQKSARINLSFDNKKEKSGNILVSGENLKKSYRKTVFENISFEIAKQKRIGILGSNGVGKTTLLKAIVGREEIEGNLFISSGVKIGYFSQELKNLDDNLSVLEELKKIDKDESYVRTLLGSMLFKDEDVFKGIKDLSLGEKVRIIFLKLVLGEHNLLILDEPTNFLDIKSREKIEEALLDYNGAILFVSHDRYFIRKMAQEIWDMEKGGLTRYLGDYEYYLEKKNAKNKNENGIKKEKILTLEMELSNISFKLLSCKDTEKEELEKRYFEISKTLRDLKRD